MFMKKTVIEILEGIKNCIVDFKALYLLRNCGYLNDYGWWNSHKRKSSIDADGNPIPWFTYPSIEFINSRINRNFDVFEYGCGNSTRWWAHKVNSVTSCEHDKSWFYRMKATVPAKVTLIFEGLEYGGDYSKAVLNQRDCFDVIVIDGRDRVRCAKNSLNAIKNDGVIIWDNTERDRYEEGYEFLKKAGYKRLDFWGVGPIGISKWCTTIFYRKDNCLNI